MKRKITFVTGNIATYHLTADALSLLIDFLPDSVDHSKVSDTVYHVTSLQAVNEVFNNNLDFPDEGEDVSEIFFFDGDFHEEELSDYQLRIKLDRVKKQFSYSEIAKDIYKVSEIKYL